jgi:hypothetical protein
MGKRLSRRALLRTLSLGAASCAVAPAFAIAAAPAARVAVSDPDAKAQAYVEDATQVDPAKNPAFSPGANCESCLLLQGKAGDTYRPCPVFAGRLVNIHGWCKSWEPEI